LAATSYGLHFINSPFRGRDRLSVLKFNHTSIQIRSLSLAMDPPVGGLFNATLMSAYRKY
ncbi:MAG: hypothetical protein N0E44_13200, partial [Candidatus Thiodiazotropha lotti]|nr:hypothetical protein [Candidatus Thiodiazotropha lotti]MCW4220841.1 hypothetical protein [Candidatus Thiodiazotropha lotti]